MKTLLTTAAVAALLASAPALAQSTVAPTIDQPTTSDPLLPKPGLMPAPAAEAPAEIVPEATPPDAAAEAPAAIVPGTEPSSIASASGYIAEQSADDQLASSWVGQSIYNSADENVGDVNDLLIGADGKLKAVVIGVGGFLGIGEKNVAVPFESVNALIDADGNIRLVVALSREALDAAPEFMTLRDLKARMDSMTPAEPAPMAPAPAQ